MTYKKYIKKLCKKKPAPGAVYGSVVSRLPWRVCLLGVIGFIIGAVRFNVVDLESPATHKHAEHFRIIAIPDQPVSPLIATEQQVPALVRPPPISAVPSVEETRSPAPTPEWRSITVQSGDNLALIFQRERLSGATLHQIANLDQNTAKLAALKPGEEIRFLVDEGQLNALEYDLNLTDTLRIDRADDGYTARLSAHTMQVKTHTASGTIQNSLFLAGRRAGLSDKMIMQLIGIYAWDIDFVKEVRSGDQFRVVYQVHFKGDERVREGPILAAEFVNQGRPLRAVRYTHANGRSDYYTPDGGNMRKTFLRTPVEFTRISSLFDPARKHPILNTIRAHRGVDYAAPTGTPVRATGDGIIDYVGRKGGYGKTVIIRHGDRHTTLYGHLSGYARSIKKGRAVKQSQIIGSVGSTGLATGPHLHYEFRINGVHHDPLKVKIQKAAHIPKSVMPQFAAHTGTLVAQLAALAAAQRNDHSIFALNEEGSEPTPAN